MVCVQAFVQQIGADKFNLDHAVQIESCVQIRAGRGRRVVNAEMCSFKANSAHTYRASGTERYEVASDLWHAAHVEKSAPHLAS